MLTMHTSREQRIADLEIHGWEPIRDGSSVGIFNRSLELGFVVLWIDANGALAAASTYGRAQWGEVRRVWSAPRPGMTTHWDAVPDTVLDRIDKRLSTFPL